MKRVLFLAACAALAGSVRAYEVAASDAMTGVKLDFGTSAVRASLDGATVFPIAYNNSASWPAGGRAAEAAVSSELTIERMTGEGADPSVWTPTGEIATVPFVTGEARFLWAPAAAKYRLRLVQRYYGDETVQTAYYDLTDAEPSRRSLAGALVTRIGEPPVYDGTPQTPAFAVALDGRTLTEGSDYTTVWYNNVSLGTAKAYVYGLGAYGDMTTLAFEISTECVDSATGDTEVADFRPGVLTNASVRATAPLAYNDTATWPIGGAAAGRTARVSVAPLENGEPGVWRVLTEAEGEGSVRWTRRPRGPWRARLEFCENGEPIPAQTLERDFFYLPCNAFLLFVR